MLNIRICAGILSLATLILAARMLPADWPVNLIAYTTVLAALCLAYVVPKPATSQLARNRVFWACLIYAVLMFVADVSAYVMETSFFGNIALAILAVALSTYAYIRKKMRRVGIWDKYYGEGTRPTD
jgi:hypothetical protein